MTHHVKPIREGYHTVVVGMTVRNASEAIEFYRSAFGAVETTRMHGPDGKSILHAEMKIGDSRIFLADEGPGMSTKSPEALGGTSMSVHLNVEDTDAAFQRAIKSGAKPIMPPMDMFWGDRYAQVSDPFGHVWGLGTHKEDLTPEEIRMRGEAFFKQMAPQRR
ncbi:MAG: VOC family protein [Thermoplasmata archaeon]|nr:VOC family protein [Thermoplasmata archaeon]